MKIGKKLFPGSIVALLLGIILATPLIYTSTVTAPTVSSELFDVSLPYAYIERQNITIIGPPFDPVDTIDVPCTTYIIGMNFTLLSETIIPCDAILEIYQINIYSDKSLIETIHRFQGLYNKIVPNLGEWVREEFFGDRYPSGAFYGSAYTDWDIGDSMLNCYSHGGDQKWEPDSEPKTLSITVKRLGWFIVNGDSSEAVVLSEPQVVEEVQLEKFGNGFLHNTVIPEKELSQLDPLKPSGNFFGLMEHSPN